jgi:hypothetical protein
VHTRVFSYIFEDNTMRIFRLTLALLLSCIHLSASDLDRIIPPEIKNDAFYSAIYQLVRTEPIRTILEIGSSSGEGSTEAFVNGIGHNANHPVLFCMELSKPRFTALKNRYKDNPSVICYNVSSVPLDSFPSEEEVLSFMEHTETSLRGFTRAEVIGWLRQDIEYLKGADVPHRGIEWIKSQNNIEHFDLVLIDGSEFTGQAELALTYGAKWILLDDIRAFKNHGNYTRLLADPLYELVEKDLSLRNGYAIFRKKS